jgi:hypothetical protein
MPGQAFQVGDYVRLIVRAVTYASPSYTWMMRDHAQQGLIFKVEETYHLPSGTRYRIRAYGIGDRLLASWCAIPEWMEIVLLPKAKPKSFTKMSRRY